MAYYEKPHPWNPGFAIPDYVRSENPGRAGGIHVTMQLPRGTFDMPRNMAKPWRTKYAIPEYIRKEPVGRGAASTLQLRRRTIPTNIPNPLGQFEEWLDYKSPEGQVQEGEEFEEMDLRDPIAPSPAAMPKQVKKSALSWLVPSAIGLAAIFYFARK